MPIDFPTSPIVGQQYTYSGVTYVYTAQGIWSAATSITVPTGTPQGRLTLQTNTPVMTTTQAAKTAIFYTPYIGNKVPIYDGTNFNMVPFAELSVATTDTAKSPAAIGVSKVNDWFVWLDGAAVRLGHGPDWTNDTTRSAGTALIMVNGILLNSASITNGPVAQRGTYVGTTRSNASSQLDWVYGTVAVGSGAQAFLYVWNAYNRVEVHSIARDSTGYTVSPTYAQGAPGLKTSFVSGLAEDPFDAAYLAGGQNTGGFGSIGVGYDSTSAFSGTAGYFGIVAAAMNGRFGATALGAHFVAGLAGGNSTVAANIFGDGGSSLIMISGLHFRFKM